MLEQMVEVYSYQLDVARESQKQVNSLRHDMKHHIIELQSMLKNTNNPEIIKYLQDMEKFMLNPKEYVSTGNKEIDGVLNYLLRNAEQVLKDVDIKIRVPEKIYWNDFNICAILGNLVDNAVREASKSEEKYLKIDIQTKKGIMLIHVKNSYSGRIIETGNKIQTSQKEVAIHGIGLENVKKIVKSNDGEIEIGYTENYFEVKILLYLSNIK
jgi:two-component system sensor histidine kinase AgrC